MYFTDIIVVLLIAIVTVGFGAVQLIEWSSAREQSLYRKAHYCATRDMLYDVEHVINDTLEDLVEDVSLFATRTVRQSRTIERKRLNSRTFNGLRVLDNTKLLSPLVTGSLKGNGDTDIEGFDTVNSISAQAPLENSLEDGEADLSLLIDKETMELKNGALASKQRHLLAEYPLSVQEGSQQGEDVVELKIDSPPLALNEHGLTLLLDESALHIDGEGNLSVIHDSFEEPLAKDTDNVVRLNIDSPLVVKDGKLGVDQKEMSKGIGAISVYSAMDEILPGVGDWIDIPDLAGDMEEYIGNAMFVKLNVSNDFSQTGGRLQIRSKGLNEIPYYSGLSGFNSSNRFTYNETLSTLTAPRFEAEAVDYNITEPRQLPTAGYVHQLYQSQAGSAIDISEVTSGRKLIKVNHDETLSINESNQLEVNVTTIADGTSVKAMNNKLTVDPYVAGDAISITDNVISSKLTYGGSLRREGDQVIGKTVLSASSNVTVVQTNPFSYEVSVLNPQSQIDNLDDKVTDLNEKTDQNKLETDNEINSLKNEDIRLDNKIDAVESRVSQQETKSDLLSNDIDLNKSNINNLDSAKQQMQGDLINLAADLSGTTELLGTIQTAQSAIQVGQALMQGDVATLKATALSLGAQITGLDSVVTAYTSLPVVRNIIGVGMLVTSDPITGTTVITASNPLMAQSKGTAPVDPILKSDDSILKDNGGGGSETGETAPPVDPPILPPNPPPPPPGGDTLRTTGRTDGNNFPCLDPIPPIFGGNDVRTNEQTWFRDSWGKRYQFPTLDVDGVQRTVLEYDENNLPIVPHGHIDIVHRKTEVDDYSSVLLTHDRHLQSGYQGVRLESMLQVPNLAIIYELWDSFMRAYVESCNYITVGQGLVKTGSTLSLSDDLSTFAKISSIKALGYKDTLPYSELTGLPSLGSLAAKNSIAWTEITSRPTLGTLSSKNTLDWNGTDIINKLTDLTTKTYVDSLSYITVGTGLVKTGSTISLGSDLGAFEVKTNLRALAYKDTLSWNDILSKPTLGTLASKSSVSWITEVSGKPDLTVYETKTALKGLAYKDKVDYTTDLINVPASVTYGSNLLFSNNTVSLNPVLTGIDSLSATGNLNLGGTLNLTRNSNMGYIQYIYNSSTGSNSCTSLQMRAGTGTGLYININAQARAAFGGGNTATIMNYSSGGLRLLGQREKGIVVDEHGAVDVSERLSVGTTSDIVAAFPPLSMTSNSTVISNQAYGNGNYVASASSIFSSTYQPYAVFAAGGGWYSEVTSGYDVTTGLYAGSQTTIVNSTTIAGEWVQILLPVGIALSSFDITGRTAYIRNVKDFTLVSSNDGSTFIHILSSTISSWINGQSQTVNVQTPTTTKPFKIYRLIIRSVSGLNSSYCYVGRLFFNGTPVSMENRGAVSASHVIADELVCNKISGDLSIDNSVEFKDDIVDNVIKYPQIQLTSATTGGYIANASSNLNGTSASWKAFTNSLEINDSYWSASTYSGGEQNMYQGTVITVVDGSNIKGEYVELEMEVPIALTAFSFAARTPEMPMFPRNYTICGSDDRSNWTEISSGTMTYTIYQNSTSVDRYVPIKNYTTKKFKVFRFIVCNLISSTYAHIGKLRFYGSNTTRKIIEAPAVKINNVALASPAYGMFQLHSSQAFSVNGTAYQLICKWTPSFGMESDTITCLTNSQDIIFKLPGIYKVEFDLDCHQSGSGSINSYFGFMAPGSTMYYEDGYHDSVFSFGNSDANNIHRSSSISSLSDHKKFLMQPDRFSAGGIDAKVNGVKRWQNIETKTYQQEDGREEE
ncbi:hypothetical protein BC832DRAFT_538935 [Gaertneriomyces semiglobifer]|nr:hypothetical protein BC832DRAFT_538935 [Gaertneriomyces semiglobifer]